MKGIRKRLLAIVAAVTMVTTILPSSIVSATIGKTETQVKNESVQATSSGETVERKIVTYFPDWAYKNPQNEYYTADRLQWDKITHVNYAFASIGTDNKIKVTNMEAATELEFPGQTNDFPYKGHFNVLNSYKKKYPNVKTMISVGGWAESTGFYTMSQTEQGRETFANSVVDFLRTYGFDGVDIDYEYPTLHEDAGNPIDQEMAKPLRKELYANYIKMMKTLREKVDAASAKDGKDYLLTAAVTGSAWVLSGMDNPEDYLKYLDFVNLMTYDFHGSWNGYVAHNSALYSDSRDPETKPLGYSYLSTDWAVKYYSGAIDPSKIVIGVPLYTRGWEKVTPSSYPGGLYGSSWQGAVDKSEGWGATGINNIWHDKLPNGEEEPGGSNPLWHVKNLLADKSLGYERYWDDVSKVPYVWNEKEKVWLSFEDEQSMGEKMDYVVNNNLGGVMFWEADGDYDYDAKTGKYVVGDTLTSLAREKLDAAGPLVAEDHSNSLPTMNYDVVFQDNFDHPYNEYKLNFVNNTGKAIAKPWKLEFDLPDCVAFKTEPWGYDCKREVRGNNIHFTITASDWQGDLKAGTTTLLEGTMTLKAPMGVKNMVLNGYASEAEWGKAPDLKAPVLSTSTNDSRDGNYAVTVDVPANSNGTTMELYEGNTKIKTETITNSSKTFKYDMKNKPNGTYDYKAVIRSGGTVVNSSIQSVYVGPKIDLKAPTLVASKLTSRDGNYAIAVDVPANSNGTTLELYEGNTKIKTETITNAAKTFTYNMTGKENGTYSYKAVIKMGGAFVNSNIVNVRVALDQSYVKYDPAHPYTFGDVVSYNGMLYQSQGYWVVGITPGTNNSVWKPMGPIPEEPIVDLAKVASKYNKQKGDAAYDPDCDLNNDGIIDLFDLVIVAKQM